MLIFDDSKGASDGKERGQLQAMVAVGSEFITYRDDESTVQKSGQFVRIEKEPGSEQPRLCTIHETPDAWAEDGGGTLRALNDEQYFGASAEQKFVRRTRMFLATVDEQGIEANFRAVGGMKTESRAPRFTNIVYTSGSSPEVHAHDRVHDVDYATQAGKRRLFSLGNGKLLLVRELTKPNDSRWYMGVADTLSTFSRRRKRTARVELVELNPETGALGKTLLGFNIHSGLGFDPYAGGTPSALNDWRPYRTYGLGPLGSALAPYTDSTIYMAVVGAMWGRVAVDGVAGDAGIQGDASDTYAVAEPAWASGGGKTYLSLVAVYPSTDDVHDPQYAGPYRLTCTRTTPNGDVMQSKIAFPAITGAPNHYYGVTGMELVRTSPTNIVLIAHVQALQSGLPGTIAPTARSRLFFWSDDNGATWTYAQVSTSAPSFPIFPYSAHLVKDAETLLVFSTYQAYASVSAPDYAGVQVHEVTRAGTQYVTTIPGSTFNQELLSGYAVGSRTDYNCPHIAFGYGGAVIVDKKPRLWMQFDPRWVPYARDKMLASPPARPQVLTSDDGGLTWARRFLPEQWQHRVGFVVGLDSKTLAVPVISARAVNDQGQLTQPKVRIYQSTDGGRKWKPTRWTMGLPAYAWLDGQFMPGGGDGHESTRPGPTEFDIDDSNTDYNRGELFPLVAVRMADGSVAPTNPARPWMTDHRFKEPTYG